MPDDKNNLYLDEALDLRAEYDARIKELRTLLPEAKESRERFAFRADDDVKRRPAAGFSPQAVREELNALAARKRTLNNAVQRANFDSRIMVAGESLSLSEALELRKAVNEQIGELSTQLAKAAYERVVYKEERDIVEAPEVSYAEVRKELDGKRRLFRALNRSLRAAAHEIAVGFKDEV
jgi:hypothetical protein